VALLEVENLNKRFPHVWANQDVCFDVREEEIHCLLGENGAGKSTLAECVYGAFRPDSGTIRLKGEPLSLASPRDATRAGIGMVHQHFALAPALSVLENVVVGTSQDFLLDLRKAEARLRALTEAYGVDLDLRAAVGDLAVGQQQWVEILKALYVGVELLILDEPTAVLTPMEAQRLFDVLRRMKGEGLSVILITHKLDEVIEVSDRVTVLAKGRVVATAKTADVTAAELARLMVGRDVNLRIERREVEPGDVVLEVAELTVDNNRCEDAVHGVSFDVREREIFGIVGVSGNGQRELFDALVGVRHPREGRIMLGGSDVSRRGANHLIQRHLASVPEDRVRDGLVMDFRIDENLVLGFHREPPFARWGFVRQSAVDDFAGHAVRTFGIAAASPRGMTGVLSGGNMQKVILARELSRTPACLVVSQPTRGLDVGASEYVRNRLLDERGRGAAIVLMSEDLDEVFDLADRIAVMFKGRFAGVLDPTTATPEDVGLLMGGVVGESAT
jgi:general nucleoside transport system ATP-binding protein